MNDGAAAGASAALWWSGFALAALGYVALSLAVGARLVLGRLAAERLADESGLTEPLDPGSRTWAALTFARSMALVAAVLCAALSPWRRHALIVGLTAGALVALAGRIAEALLAPRWPERLLAASAFVVRLLGWALGPVLAPLARAHESLLQRSRRERASADQEAREEQLEDYIRDAEEGGILAQEEGRLLREIVDAGDVTVKDVMTPRVEIVAVQADDTLEHAVAVFTASRHSRLLVHDGGLDRIVGVLPVRDLLVHLRPTGGDVRVRALMRPALHVPAGKPVLELLRELQTERQQVAVVVDEYGGTAGIASLEDLVEEIVGEIRDEHESEEEQIRSDGRGGLVADGLVLLSELGERLGRQLAADGVETVGGLVFARLGRLPHLGDRVEVDGGLAMEVVRLRGRRIAAVRITTPGDGPPRSEGGG